MITLYRFIFYEAPKEVRKHYRTLYRYAKQGLKGVLYKDGRYYITDFEKFKEAVKEKSKGKIIL